MYKIGITKTEKLYFPFSKNTHQVSQNKTIFKLALEDTAGKILHTASQIAFNIDCQVL